MNSGTEKCRKFSTAYIHRTLDAMRFDTGLEERTNIDKLAYGGSRDIRIQLDSIMTNPQLSIEGDVILLVDDVTTTGASLDACRKILYENGATRVAMLALGQSV